MKPSELLRHISTQLGAEYSPSEAQALARIIVEDVLGMNMTRVLADLEPDVAENQLDTVQSVVSRLCNHEPIQYIVGHTQFCGLNIGVNPSVLIPRPETAQIVDIALTLFPTDSRPTAMDACTGSGCIAIALKHQRPSWTIDACDISVEALTTAKNNALANNVDINFEQLDILSADLPTTPFDLIISNPPYVKNEEKSSMESNVLEFEPHLALFVEDHAPLVFYDALARWGQAVLKPKGYLLVEINHLLATETRNLLEQHGYNEIETHNDIFDKPRFILCQKHKSH